MKLPWAERRSRFTLLFERLAIDVVCDVDASTVKYLAEDRRMESLDGYFRSFRAAELEGIRAIAMDMWPPYISSTLRHVPGARDKIVFDPYHIMSYMNEAFLALLITGTTLNIFSIIGIIMLMGLVTKNAILLVDFTNQGLREGKSQHDAILDAGQVRLRPILMTTMAMIFGMLPMAIGSSDGGEQNAPMGRAVIGGIITSTLLTLVVVPVLYTYLDAWGRRVSARFAKGKPAAAEGAAVPSEAD